MGKINWSNDFYSRQIHDFCIVLYILTTFDSERFEMKEIFTVHVVEDMMDEMSKQVVFRKTTEIKLIFPSFLSLLLTQLFGYWTSCHTI